MCEKCISEVKKILNDLPEGAKASAVMVELPESNPDASDSVNQFQRYTAILQGITAVEVKTVSDSKAMMSALSQTLCYLAECQMKTIVDKKATADDLYDWRDDLFRLIDIQQNTINDLLIEGLQGVRHT
jgi:hypothetical protein